MGLHRRSEAITRTRTDAASDVQRLDVQPELFGAWCFICKWGRIGRAWQVRLVPDPISQELFG